jgi:hypothetical protein
MSGPMKLSALINGDDWNTLDIFANPTEVNPPSPTDPNVIYLGPGYYTGDIVVPSGKTLYIAGGAAVKGEIFLDNTTNSKVIGRGVIDHPSARAISANYSNQVTIDGVIINDYGFGNNGGNAIHLADATNATINNVKAYSGNKWGDGIDLFNASNVSINDIFMRTSDDAIAVYGSRAGGGIYQGNHSNNISVTNSILTPDTAHPINIGTHGDPSLPGGGGSIESLRCSDVQKCGLRTGSGARREQRPLQERELHGFEREREPDLRKQCQSPDSRRDVREPDSERERRHQRERR